MPATPRAATASAFTSQGWSIQRARLTRNRPAITTEEDQIWVEKCSASASRAWLLYFLATRASMRERDRSTRIDTPITTKDQILASTSTCLWNRREKAS